MQWNRWVRQGHRWVSIVFTVTVAANFIAMGLGESPALVVYSPLIPLFLLLFSGLYMFALPYGTKGRRTVGQQVSPVRKSSSGPKEGAC